MRFAVVAAAVGLAVLGGSPAAAAPARMSCQVSAPISAASLNAGGTWSFEVVNAAPNVTYQVKVQWAGDPSNGGHPSTGIRTDATGYGVATLPRLWTPDGFLPGYFIDPHASATLDNFVAVPGTFSVQIGPKTYTGERLGKTTCSGLVTE